MTSPGVKRIALVTGGSSGIGEAFAEVFAAEGFDIVITARREERLRAVQSRLQEKYGVRVELIVEDLEQPAAPARLCAALEAHGLKIDVLVNNAGYGVPGSYLSSSWDVHARFLQIMVTAVADLTYRLLPGMIDRQYGRIINVASVSGLQASGRYGPPYAGYAASKAGLMGLTRELAGSWGHQGIRVNAIAPGFFHSRLADAAIALVEDSIKERSPIPRVGDAGELKGVVVFLAADASNYITGQVVVVDGGRSIV